MWLEVPIALLVILRSLALPQAEKQYQLAFFTSDIFQAGTAALLTTCIYGTYSNSGLM